ncbi:ABC transporter permease [Terrabacter sp. C0L_2]|uniref:ABC transporter permease n=1 Tax=Terrabacter sp. C0L_2 TaxID=3108389 RepID=UPI002ED10761|nr:ABC transporter permease [Terrabacter sp. C0L_2]
MTWWHGTSLVLGRGLREQLRSKTFKIVTGVLLLLSIGAVVVPRLVTGGPTTYTLATVGRAPVALTTALGAAARSADFRTIYVERPDEAGVRSAVQRGEATVGLAGDRMYVPERAAGPFPGIVAQSLVRIETLRVLTDLGLTSEQVARLDSVRPPEQVFVASAQDQGRANVGYAVGLVLYLALLFSGQVISMTVATEKASRISEVLLAVLRPSQVLVGTVLAVATVATLQLLVLAVPILVGATVTGTSWLPAVAAPDLALAITWFVLGFCLFAFLYAAGGALVDKVTEAGTAVLPVTMLIIAGYLLGVIIVIGNPSSAWSVAASLFPLTAPLTMPIRWASGEVPVYQLALALLLTALAGLGSIWLASTVYRRALVITGHRVRLAELFGHGGGAGARRSR